MSRPIDGDGTLSTSTDAPAVGVPPITPSSAGSRAATAVAADNRRIHLLGAWCESFIALRPVVRIPGYRGSRRLSYREMGGQSSVAYRALSGDRNERSG